jgi:protein-disulfide isomerase
VANPQARLRDTPDAARGRQRESVSMSRRALVAGSLALAVLTAGVLVAIFALRSAPAPSATALMGEARVANMLRGIPQHGTALGSPTAPVTLIEFADPQCPYCGIWERDALPAIVTRYVRPGKVRIVFNGMAFVGADSGTALRTALAAASQDRFWNVIALLYENQGVENTGWVTEPLLGAIGGAVPGLDTQQMLADRNSAAVDNAGAAASSLAQRMGVNSTPSFALGPTGGRLQVVDAAGLTSALDAALAQ